ncbi:MAG: sensor histidine kinase [Bacteroidetes bacterium SW_9_63_38]|nr:MAG: sensor histidine kinase [Bacteroidetes bacterium SW_9_63_38]
MTSANTKDGLLSTDVGKNAAPPEPEMTWTGVGLAIIGWLLYALLYTFFIARQQPASPFVRILAGQVVYSVILGVYSVPIWWITVREMNRLHWGWSLCVHLILGPLPAATTEVAANYQWILFGNLTIYAIQFAIYHLVRNVQRLRYRERQATALMARAREQRLAALKAQVNPHFLFNTLNSISATLRRNPEQAREMIAKLSDMMRYALEGSERDLVPLREELNFTRRYLDLEQHRFSDRLEVEVDVQADEEALDTPVPPMVQQPLVENALRHGIAPKKEGGTVAVRIHTENNRVYVHVEDTGVGPGDDDPLSALENGTGLANTSTRLEHTYGPEAALRTAENEPTGFAVWFSIPRNGCPDA